MGLIVIASLIYIASRRGRHDHQTQALKSGKNRKKSTNPNEGTIYEKDAHQRAELSPSDRFEIGGDEGSEAHELDTTK